MPSVNLRLSDEEHATLAAAAEDNHRSLQKEIIHRLFPRRLAPTDAAFKEWEDHFKPDPKPPKTEKPSRRR